MSGHPTPLRPHSEHSGSWLGVAIVSKHPSRAIPVEWPNDIFQSSRIQVATTLCHDLWVTGAVVYGEPPGQFHPLAQQHTEKLLEQAIEVVSNMPGLRYVAGDFNFEKGHLEAFHCLERMGFKDLQDLAMCRWGVQPHHTCKGTTRKDFCFISPELQDLLEEVLLEHDVWSDHSVLVGKFRGAQTVVRQWWRQPQAFPWPDGFSSGTVPIDVNFTGEDPTGQYKKLWEQIETGAQQFLDLSSKKVHPSQLGRAKTLTTVPRKGPVVPVSLKPSRSGDVRPLYYGQSRQHALWFRQLRRLQNFVRFSKVHMQDNCNAHGAALWRSIVMAKGFAHNFVHWWHHECGTHLDGAPHQCPLVPPDHSVASAMYFSFAIEVRSLERKLLQLRCKYAKERRCDQAHLIFKDIQKTPPDRLDLMLGSQQAEILSIDEDNLMLTISHPLQLDLSRECFVAGKPREMIHVENCEVFLMDLKDIKVGDRLVQATFNGKTSDLFTLFRDEWSKRWDRHRNVPSSQWKQIMDFNAHHLPRVECRYEPLTADQLCQEVSRKNPKRATGPDGVSLIDLRSIPRNAVEAHAQLLSRAEIDGTWPEQALVGRVASLGKVEHPTRVGDFRPITVISHIYRLWSGLRAKEILSWLDGVCPAFLLGNRPSCMAAHAWSHVQWLVEMTYLKQSKLAGLTADIQKAFNHLPREVLLHACRVVGIPQPILLAWAGALSGLCRRFQIRDSLGPPIHSSTGCPEGCAMSCIGMLMVDMMLHRWLVVQFPLCQPMSYVDDWQVITEDPHDMTGIYESVVAFTGAVDLLLDEKKTFVWTLDSAARKTFRQQGILVKKSAKALGAQMQYSKQHSAFVINDRIKDLQPLWGRLRLSPSPYKVKVNAIKMAAWPRGLHGIAAVRLGLTRFGPLRSAAMKGLQAEGSGCNPVVHLGLVEQPRLDPLFWSIMTTFRSLRDCSTLESVTPLLLSIVHDEGLLPRGGPTSALYQRIQILGWTISDDGHINDAFGRFSLFDVSLPELELRAEAAWCQVVASEVQYRPCFQGLVNVDARTTRAYLSKLSVSDQALFRKALNGASFTNDSQCYYTASGTSKCEYCGQDDSRYHRFWICPVFEECRSHVSSDLRSKIPTLPSCLTQAGWLLKPPTTDDWWETLLAISPPEVTVTSDLPKRECYDVFTDGSCMWPKETQYRIASWSVCLAGMTTDWTESRVLQAGPLPGLLQSAYRAELYAVYIATQWSRINQHRIRIWSDCLGVVKRFRRLVKSKQPPKHGTAHFDLWMAIYDEIHHLSYDGIRITKVAAHQDAGTASTDFEVWAVVNNLLADRAARLANVCRPPEFWQIHRCHVFWVQQHAAEGFAIQTVILDISRKVVQRVACLSEEGAQSVEHREVESQQEPQGTVGRWSPFQVITPLPWALTQVYGFAVIARMAAWLAEALTVATALDEPCRWISFHQLYLDYQMGSGDIGPIYDKGWTDQSRRPNMLLRVFPFRKRSSWFSRVLKRIVRHSAGTLDSRVVRPHSTVFALHTASAWLPWAKSRLDWIEEWTIRRAPRCFTRDGHLIDSLPVPTWDRRWPELSFEQRPLCL